MKGVESNMKGDSKEQEMQQNKKENEQKFKHASGQEGYDKRLDGPNRPSV